MVRHCAPMAVMRRAVRPCGSPRKCAVPRRNARNADRWPRSPHSPRRRSSARRNSRPRAARSCSILRIEEARRMEERVAVHHAVAQRTPRSSRPGIMEKTRFCSPHLSRVWKPTRLYIVPVAVLLRGAARRRRALRPVRGSTQADGLHRPERHHHFARARAIDLDGHAAFEDLRRRQTRAHPPFRRSAAPDTNASYSSSVHRAVEIVVAAAIAPLPEHLRPYPAIPPETIGAAAS